MKSESVTKLGLFFFIPLVVLVFSLGCGRFTSNSGSPGTGGGTPLLAVADTGNNRVLIFDSSLATGESASVVLGQADFTHAGIGTTATTLANPAGVAVDRSGNLYVTDQGNCRVLQFATPFSTNMAATLALGQPNLVTGTCPNGALSTSIALGQFPGGVAVDSSGDIWVADSYYSRIVEYVAPIVTSENASATAVLGQTMVSGTSGGSTGCNQNLASPTAKTLCFPSGLAFDGTGNLWVVDNGNNRVLKFPKASLGTTDAAATVEFGQPAGTAFTSGTANNGGVTASSLHLPLPSATSLSFAGIAFDAFGDLWIADTNNNRVLMYPKGNLGSDGATASIELGQPSGGSEFTSNQINNPTLGASTLNHPIGLAFDTSGNLIVGDTGNNRVLVFSNPTSASGISAGLVLGQASFASSAINTTQTGLSGPIGVAILP